MEFRTTVELGGRTATGLRVPDDVVEALGAGKRPPVQVTVGGHSYRTTVAPMGGAFFVPLAAEHREAAGLTAGQEVDVRIELDTAPRETALPDDLAAALDADPGAKTEFESLDGANRYAILWRVHTASTPATRAKRIAAAVEMLREGRRIH